MNGLKKTLIEMAHSNQIEVENVNSERGILFGRSVPFNVNSIIFVSAKHGLLGKKEQKENIPYERKILKLETCRIACSGSGEGITMNTAGTIRQMLGWCPNASITRVREDKRFDNTIVNAPDSGGGIDSISRWLGRIFILMVGIFILMVIHPIGAIGILIVLIIGLRIISKPKDYFLQDEWSLRIKEKAGHISWINRDRNRYLIACIINTLFLISWFITYEISMYVFMAGFFIGIALNVLVWIFDSHWLDKITNSKTPVRDRRQLVFFILIIPVLIVFGYLRSYGQIVTISALSGFIVTTWIAYLQIVYWELKNKKVIVTHGFLWQTVVAASPKGNAFIEVAIRTAHQKVELWKKLNSRQKYAYVIGEVLGITFGIAFDAVAGWVNGTQNFFTGLILGSLVIGPAFGEILSRRNATRDYHYMQ